MNFKKTLTVAAVASIAAVGLVSCGKDDKIDTSNVTLNLALSYKGEAYIKYNRNRIGTLGMPNAYVTLDGKILVEGETLLPVWQRIQKNLNFTIADAAPTAADTATMMQTILQGNFKGLNDLPVDVLQVMSGNSTFIQSVDQGLILNLDNYKDKLPDLYAFLEKNKGVKDQMLMVSGDEEGIFFAPYFDGIDQLEKGFNMNLEAVRALLDGAVEKKYDSKDATTNRFKNADSFDEAVTLTSQYGGTGTGNTASYIQSLNNQEIAVAKKNANGEYVQDKIKVTFAKDVVTRQNELTVKNGKTLTETLISYIDEVYGAYIGEGKIFKNRSEIFTSASACYNADELIALLRCVKTNPNYLTGKADNNMVPFFPRTGEANRVRAFFEFGQVFGLRGSLSGENSQLWYNEAGELVDGRTQNYSYAVLDKLNALQNEGLFPTNWIYEGTNGKSEFRSNTLKAGTGFMCYDYSNVTAFNKIAGSAVTEIEPVLAPVAKWPVQKDSEDKTIVGYNTTDKVSYTRFSEDNRSLKDGGWCLSAELGKKGNEAKLAKALELVNYLYTQEGSFIEAFGTSGDDNTGYSSGIATDAAGVKYPILTDAYKARITEYGKGTWHNYMTRFEGSCLGIGNIRSNYIEAQNTDVRQELGLIKYAAAEATGSMYSCKTYGKTFFRSVPTSISLSTTELDTIKKDAKDIQDFWTMANTGTSIGGGPALTVIKSGWAAVQETYTLADLQGKFAASNESYLKFSAGSIGLKYATTNQYPYFG